MSQIQETQVNESKVAAEVAEHEFDRWCSAMKLRFDVAGMDAEDRSQFNKQKGVLVDAIQDGSLCVNDRGEFVFTPECEPRDAITFREPRGADFMESDQEKKGHEVKRGFAVMAAITGQNKVRFAKMQNRDLKVCMAIVALFLG